MAQQGTSLALPFVGGIQASASILLTIGYGLLASQCNLMEPSAAGQISRTSVNMFLPALLITNLGSQLHLDNILLYIPILVWAVAYQVCSLLVARAVVHIFRMPRWAVGAVAFNNSAAFPLLLLQGLDTTGVLKPLLTGPDDSSSAALDRARSYFLVSAFVSNTITFGIGSSQLRGHEEDAPGGAQKVRWQDERRSQSPGDPERQSQEDTQGSHEPDSGSSRTSLLPDHSDRFVYACLKSIGNTSRGIFRNLPQPIRRLLRSFHAFLSTPFVGGVIGIFIGFTPPLHRLFFAETDQGGYFSAWLTESTKHIGQLFVSLQMVIVGVKLSVSLRREKRHEDTGYLPWGPVVFAALFRFILWPAISIPLIWVVATKTKLLAKDPMLWFTMMMMPVGPTAMKLMALADVSRVEKTEKMVIARFLALIYGMTPLTCLAVVGSLKASEAAKSRKL
ncbi:uncharacterized protein Z520_05955 [Fonsecaea multimorphosa CBS 102226]|uniref:Auxin efflux carrier n=1 Tax=Fonsecaea multimorphosa CBS 102226 TaxID=1442371 RepID=A0A0D2K640_9EURO|nr:uncharacterized protein Z520_05955 [Fonsecaea multimorphosa CBS 102226]KIX98654.1 hypothetical protein Z520_05955 [Fonsecaea multimorphosa CBS 102226]OAL24840.1 hypothetical protein AYO22_05629 [Fonsecaea multimorphosa]